MTTTTDEEERIVYVALDESSQTEAIHYDANRMEEGKPYFIRWDGEDWILRKEENKVIVFYKREDDIND